MAHRRSRRGFRTSGAGVTPGNTRHHCAPLPAARNWTHFGVRCHLELVQHAVRKYVLADLAVESVLHGVRVRARPHADSGTATRSLVYVGTPCTRDGVGRLRLWSV